MEQGRRRLSGGRDAAIRAACVALPLLAMGAGCGIGPRNFRSLTHPAPVVRARSVALGDGLSAAEVVPALIERLGDPDPVVRLTAHEELRRRTGQDFGYVPWAPPAERTPAVQRWRSWWNGRQGGTATTRTNR